MPEILLLIGSCLIVLGFVLLSSQGQAVDDAEKKLRR